MDYFESEDNPDLRCAAPIALSLAPRTNAEMADVMAGLLRAAASGCANHAARQKLQHAMRNALDAAAIMRRRSMGVAHAPL